MPSLVSRSEYAAYNEQYQLVSTDEQAANYFHPQATPPSTAGPRYTSSKFLSVILPVLAIVLSSFSCVVSMFPSLGDWIERSVIQSSPLELVTSYWGLNQRQERILLEDNSLHLWTEFGTVFPLRRRILVNESISIIWGARALDFGMEECKVTVEVPVDYSNNSFQLNPDSITLDVWRLHVEKQSDLSRLRGKPPRAVHLGPLSISAGSSNSTQTFFCASGVFYAFEVECITNGCILDFWQDRISKKLEPYFVSMIRKTWKMSISYLTFAV
ncbi:uncharacterized protein FOMMEDRAFT_30941 [Fomitiporia mediterranea MF3/22]|uniref:uncharacterized protein n=1 Tax=Fomitiporia mediterranea (strain MF3/22) TaxID=694068 RepID=UPI0004407F7C|nr:uncharacterized protein FOMMEDRAFT_30941 [Fomitiporia mediterranea MF3/22]EJC99623.1 hypothetical protein FOMMEDRAFT_30941 [Fomitiporia mediterranea MF3/22]